MDEIHTAEAVFRILRERRQGVTDLMIYGNVKSMEQYRELMGNIECLLLRGGGFLFCLIVAKEKRKAAFTFPTKSLRKTLFQHKLGTSLKWAN